MRAGLGFDQLSINPHAVARLAHAAFQHITHPKCTSDLLDVHCLAFEGEA